MTNKPWKSYVDQLALLKSRGLVVENDAAALDYLGRIGYYRLSGYWYPFRRMKPRPVGVSYREDEFIEGSRFEDAVKLYIFDKKLRLLALDALERIELAVRVDVAHMLGKHDIYAQENPDMFHGNFAKKKINGGRHHGKTQHQVWLENHERLIHRARREPFVAHNRTKYGKLPIWVAIEIWDFGALSRLFAGMKYQDKADIANKYGFASGKELQGCLRSLNFIRNVAAHHSRLWNINVLELACKPKNGAYWQSLDNSRPFLYYCFMQAMMRVICPNSSWASRFEDLTNSFPKIAARTASLTDFGIVEGWQSWPLWEKIGTR